MHTGKRLSLLLLLVILVGCGDNATTNPAVQGRVPLTQLGSGAYKGFVGGLYPSGTNVEPSAHSAAGQSRAQAIEPLDTWFKNPIARALATS